MRIQPTSATEDVPDNPDPGLLQHHRRLTFLTLADALPILYLAIAVCGVEPASSSSGSNDGVATQTTKWCVAACGRESCSPLRPMPTNGV